MKKTPQPLWALTMDEIDRFNDLTRRARGSTLLALHVIEHPDRDVSGDDRADLNLAVRELLADTAQQIAEAKALVTKARKQAGGSA